MPLRAPRSAWLATLSLAVYYTASMARDLSLYDSGELALAAVQLGLGHPPGQPLHTLLGFALSRMPGLPALVGVNLVSALPGALVLIPATSLAQALLGERAAPAVLRGVPWLLALAGLHPALWEPSTRVEVYALGTFGGVWSLAATAALTESVEVRSLRRHVFAIGVALGLAASANPVIALTTALALAPALIRRALGTPSLAPAGVLGGLLGLVPYAYVPLIAARTDVMVWGAPRDADSALRYFLLRDYVHNQGISFGAWLAHAGAWLEESIARGTALAIVLGCAGHLLLARKSIGRLTVPLLLLLSLANVCANVVFHVEVPDYDGYLATALWGLLAGAAAFCLQRRSSPQRQAIAVALTTALAAVMLGAAPPVWSRTRHADRLARVLAERVLDEAPARAIVLAETDALAGALFYLQGAEGQRRDVAVLAFGLASSSWHWEQLLHAHRDLHRIALRGPGGRAGRIRRLLEANPERPVLLERWAIGREVGLRMCPGGLYLRAGSACAGAARHDPAIAALLAGQLARLGEGSPHAASAIAQVSYGLGEGLWRLGEARAAHDVLLAGVPRRMQPEVAAARPLEDVPPLPPSAAGVRFERPAVLGDPARNLFLAGAIVNAAGQRERAQAYLGAAARAGLPEAQALLRR